MKKLHEDSKNLEAAYGSVIKEGQMPNMEGPDDRLEDLRMGISILSMSIEDSAAYIEKHSNINGNNLRIWEKRVHKLSEIDSYLESLTLRIKKENESAPNQNPGSVGPGSEPK